MIRRSILALSACALLGAGPDWPPPAAMVRYNQPVIAIEHVRVVDGTGAPARADQTVLIDHGKISAVGPSSSAAVPAGAKIIDGSGETLTPGFVGTHDHLFYISGGPMEFGREMPYSFPRLYLAGGVTTIRTTGGLEPYTDLRIERAIREGQLLGPDIDVTGPYSSGFEPDLIQVYPLRDVADARQTTTYWAERGAKSFKLYTNIPPDIAQSVIQTAHAHGLRVAGHLCSIGFTQAAQMGIDSLEHGFIVDTEFYPNKKPGICPDETAADARLFRNLSPNDPRVRQVMRTMIRHHVALSSTLAVLEGFVPPPMRVQQRNFSIEDAESVADVMAVRKRILAAPAARRAAGAQAFRTEQLLEAAFYRMGGLVTQGPDPTGYGNTLPGFGDQRDMELLVQAGLTPVEAIHVATQNGAILLGRDAHIGTIAPGKNADLVLIQGNPAQNIDDIEHVQFVFKDGVGYDSAKIINSIRGIVGRQ